MLSFYKRYYKTVFDITLMIVTVYLFMLLFSYLYRIATPIFLALAIFAAIEPLAKFLNKRGLKKSFASAVSILMFVLVILAVLAGVSVIFTSQVISLSHKIGEYTSVLQRQIDANADKIKWQLDALPADLVDQLKEYASAAASYASNLASNLLLMIVGWITSISSFVINFTIGIILAYFLSVEIDLWKRLAYTKTPGTFKKAFFFLKDNVLLGIVTYLKAQLKLVSITFLVIFIALLALGVNNAFSVALLSGLFDILPLLGVSTVFIPWIVYLLIVGNLKLAISLFVLLAVVIGVRQILEPKITGESLGVSAFTMLAFMIVSLSLFGVAGVILSPILIILIKALYEQGYLRKWIRLPDEEFDPTYID